MDLTGGVPTSCCVCGGIEDVRRIQMKVPGTTNTYEPGSRRNVCKKCRKKPDYRGRFRIVEG